MPIEENGLVKLSTFREFSMYHLDIEGIPLSAFSVETFKFFSFEYLYTDNYRMCCRFLFSFSETMEPDKCYGPPLGPLSSCENILM